MRNTGLKFIGAVVLALSLAACGGGGGDEVVDTTPPVSTGTIGGVVASGASLPFANVTIKDASGVTTNTTTDADGQFTLSVSSAVSPYLIKAVSIDGLTTVYAIAFDEDVGGSISVTPLSSIVVANVFGTDGGTAFTNFTSVSSAVDVNFRTAMNNLYTTFTPIANALGVTLSEPFDLVAAFVPDHTGVDRLLDAINVNIVGGNIVVSDKIGNTIMTDSISSNTDVPIVTVPVNIAATADQSSGISSYLANLTTHCGNLLSLSTCSTHAPTQTFTHSRSDNTFMGWVKWEYVDDSTPVAIEYKSPTVKFVDEVGTWAEFIEIVSTPTGSVTLKDAGYFVQEAGTWVFIGDRLNIWLDRRYTESTARIDWKVRTHSINPEAKDYAYIRITSAAFNGEVRLYKNDARWPDEFDNYVSENCTAIINVANSASTTCTSGYTHDGLAYPKTYLLPVTFQMVDTSGNDVPNWGGTTWVRN